MLKLDDTETVEEAATEEVAPVKVKKPRKAKVKAAVEEAPVKVKKPRKVTAKKAVTKKAKKTVAKKKVTAKKAVTKKAVTKKATVKKATAKKAVGKKAKGKAKAKKAVPTKLVARNPDSFSGKMGFQSAGFRTNVVEFLGKNLDKEFKADALASKFKVGRNKIYIVFNRLQKRIKQYGLTKELKVVIGEDKKGERTYSLAKAA